MSGGLETSLVPKLSPCFVGGGGEPGNKMWGGGGELLVAVGYTGLFPTLLRLRRKQPS